jgi:hypothetical protein
MKTFTEEQILEPLGGWDNLVLMCEAREKREVFENSIDFKVGDFEVRCGKNVDYLFGPVWSLRIKKGNNHLYNSPTITAPSLVLQAFEYYTNLVLGW